MTIDIGKGFVDRLTPRTLQTRVGELVKAADMTMFKKPGVIPSK
jgi:hypothetical protein